ncbi:disease resistance protein RUN1 [Medicago truncatula]|uniref:disease resistance protein RUN1 n=1 Tax=Medicago truncatula TaxID=3880 RepID=UPI0019670312|nr:disease resistance protein RUN1 [Medicago truncatula]
MAIQSPSSSSSFSHGFTYQVFLSFRGTDTRHSFTGNLYKALTDKGIHTFIDDNDLQRGDEITPSLLKAIDESRIFIPVFSINYASSSFCLDELVHIIHCYKTKGRLVLPVFFGVEPTNVRHQKGSYGEALAEHEKRFQNDKNNMERLQRWKVALSQAANLSGYHDSPPGYEYKLIGKIVKYISNKISRHPLHVATYPVGLQSRVQQVKSLLDEGPDDGVHMVGIFGIGGLGKSTLARAIYNFVADQFEGLCFLHDVRENSAQNDLKHLQEKLLLKTTGSKIKLDHVCEGIPFIKERLCRKKILLILDDVDDRKQLHALAGGLDWFGPGSRVIITTRNKHLLASHRIEKTYPVEGLNGIDALELLRWMAFKNDNVPSGYEDILNRAVAYASGLPLVLEVMGSNLFGKNIEEWKNTLDGYDRIPNKEIQKILRVSYDALEEEEQSVFLDIACCLKGYRLTEVENILHSHYDHCITHHLRVLAEKSLIDTNYCYVTLHNLIEDMGKEVVRQESIKEPGERSRLCCHDDIVNVLKENTGTSKIQMMYMNFHSMESIIDQKGMAFKKMTRLKTLIIENGHCSKGLKYLPSSLKALKWEGCLSKSLSSSILSKKFQDMTILILDHCEYLTHIPDVSGLSNLEKLSFECCYNLITIHNSIGHLNKLERLSAFGCRKLKRFPPLGLASLKELDICCCSSLKSFPELLCKMTNIKEIDLDYNISIGELPSSFQNLSELDELSVREARMLRFPKHNDRMYSKVFSKVTKLRIYECNLSDEYLQIVLKWCVNVELLDLSHNNFKILPECLSECHHLKHLGLHYCSSLEEIRGIPPNLKELSAYQCKSLSSSCRRMLMSQELHEARCTRFLFPNEKEGIPDWFEHQSRGDTISFWFRKEIPSMTYICIPPEGNNWSADTRVNYFVNGYEIEIDYCPRFSYVYFKHTNLFHTPKLNELGKRQFEYIMEKGLLKNEWIHVEFKVKDRDNIIFRNAQMGIHVWKEKSNTEEENVVFIDPYIRKTKSNEYLNASLSQKKRKRNKFSIRINLQKKIWVHPKFRARFRKQKEHQDSLN